MSVVGDNLKKLREAAGLTQADLAERAGLATIRAIERGRRAGRTSTLERIAGVLRVPLARLFEEPRGRRRSRK